MINYYQYFELFGHMQDSHTVFAIQCDLRMNFGCRASYDSHQLCDFVYVSVQTGNTENKWLNTY